MPTVSSGHPAHGHAPRPRGTASRTRCGSTESRSAFAVTWQGGEMAGVRRGHIEFNLVRTAIPGGQRMRARRIGVDDLEALTGEYRTAAVEVGLIEMKSWGRWEFHMILLPGVCWEFYQAATCRDRADATLTNALKETSTLPWRRPLFRQVIFDSRSISRGIIRARVASTLKPSNRFSRSSP